MGELLEQRDDEPVPAGKPRRLRNKRGKVVSAWEARHLEQTKATIEQAEVTFVVDASGCAWTLRRLPSAIPKPLPPPVRARELRPPRLDELSLRRA